MEFIEKYTSTYNTKLVSLIKYKIYSESSFIWYLNIFLYTFDQKYKNKTYDILQVASKGVQNNTTPG